MGTVLPYDVPDFSTSKFANVPCAHTKKMHPSKRSCAQAHACTDAHRTHTLHMQAGQVNQCPSEAEQAEALVAALTDVLWQARTNSSAVLAVPAPERGVDPQLLSYPQLMRSLVTVTATTKAVLQVCGTRAQMLGLVCMCARVCVSALKTVTETKVVLSCSRCLPWSD